MKSLMRSTLNTRQMSHHLRHTRHSLVRVNYNNLCTQSYHSLQRSDCGSCQIANMASVTNADDNDKACALSSSRHLLDIPRTRSRFGEHSFTVAGPSAWNTLPINITTASSVESFKRLLKTHLFEISFQS